MTYEEGLFKVKKEVISSSIKEKEAQLKRLAEHAQKSEICSSLYDKVLIEKAILKKQLDDIRQNSILKKIAHLAPRKEKLICDYFEG